MRIRSHCRLLRNLVGTSSNFLRGSFVEFSSNFGTSATPGPAKPGGRCADKTSRPRRNLRPSAPRWRSGCVAGSIPRATQPGPRKRRRPRTGRSALAAFGGAVRGRRSKTRRLEAPPHSADQGARTHPGATPRSGGVLSGGCVAGLAHAERKRGQAVGSSATVGPAQAAERVTAPLARAGRPGRNWRADWRGVDNHKVSVSSLT